MKRLSMITAICASLFVLSFSACTKDYTCECESSSFGTTDTQSYTFNGTKTEATDECSEKEEELNGVFNDVDCSIK